MEFQVGDRVQLLCDNPDRNGELRAGDIGVIVNIGLSTRCGVDWLRDVGGHDCGERCPVGHGWYVWGYQLSVESSETLFEACKEQEISDLLS